VAPGTSPGDNAEVGTLDAADDAYARGAWGEVRAALTAADADGGLDADHLERLAVAAHCLGLDEESVDAWTRAHAAHLADGSVERAALAACWCSFGLVGRGELARAGGWLARARTLCEEHGLDDGPAGCAVRTQLAAGSMFGGDFARALGEFESAQEHADRVREPSLRALARLGRGQCLCFVGRPDVGLPLIDEVIVAITTDDVSPLVAGLAYCAAIEACQHSLDVRRAQEWTAALSRWCDAQPDLVPYRGNCLVHRAEILTLHGAWAEAVDEAVRARDRLADGVGGPPLGNAYYRLGELHRLRGEYADAEAAYLQASRHGHEPQPGFGLLRNLQGHPESARAAIRRALAEATDVLVRALLLDASVELALAAGDVSAARSAADELATIADRADAGLLRTRARQARGAVRLAEGDAGGALGILRTAWTAWHELGAPYEAARIRVLIGTACRALGDDDTAEMEYDAARWVFEELGAAPDLAAVRRLSRRTPADRPGGLTLREVQVLRLVAAGRSNRAIAEELFLAEKTVHRHLSNIFAKLGVGSRTAATAFAFEHQLV
jgi:DNA-binding CsgD family transcriptional regulator